MKKKLSSYSSKKIIGNRLLGSFVLLSLSIQKAQVRLPPETICFCVIIFLIKIDFSQFFQKWSAIVRHDLKRWFYAKRSRFTAVFHVSPFFFNVISCAQLAISAISTSLRRISGGPKTYGLFKRWYIKVCRLDSLL